MFDLVHKYKKVVTIILGLIALTFVTWGIESYSNMRTGRDVVASVNGIDISVREFEDELLRQQEQVRQLLGQNFDASDLDTPETRRAILERMINERLVASEAAKAGLAVSDQAVLDTIHSIAAFRDAQGNFSKAAYEAVLRSQNPPMTPAQFESRLRYDLSLAQLAGAVREGAIPSRTVVSRLAALEAQRREIAESRIDAKQFLPKVKVDEAQAKAHYEANKDDYRTPERIKAQYVMLSAEAIAAREKVTPEEVRKQWESAQGPKLREKEEARKKAEAIAAEVRKDPESFAEVAKRESQDPGTRGNGGDLGFNARGSFVKPFEDALFRMKPGQISGVIESEFGFHVIRLTGIQKKDGKEERRSSHILITAPVDARPFEAMRGEIEAELRKARASQRFAEASDEFRNMVYEQFDSLQPAADRFNLNLQTTGWISRASRELGALDNPKLIAALFSPDAIEKRRNTDAVEVAPATLVAARVAEHQPAAQRSFEEVRGEIVEMLRQREAAEMARKEGEAKLEQLRKGADAGLKWGQTRVVSRREPHGLPGSVLRQVMSADTSKLPAHVGAASDDGFLLVRISKVIEADAKALEATGNRPAALLEASQYDAYVASLRQQADIDISQRNLEKR